MKQQWQQYKNILNSVVKPALGCTEPIAAAYASALAADLLPNPVERISVSVSDNLYKNSMGVFVPGTGKIGLPIASAVGALAGDADAGLEVLAKITEAEVNQAQTLIDQGAVSVLRTAASEFIYCYVEAQSGADIATVEISGGHTNVIKKTLNNTVLFSQPKCESNSTACVCDNVDISIDSIYEFAINAEFNDIEFILKAAELNASLAQEGLNNEYGLQVGRSLAKSIESGFLSADLANNIIMHTAAASDARMGGATLAAMSNYGSGNQGIAATVPLVELAKHYKSNDEKLARALIMSHLGAIYIKCYYPPLSAFCGNTVTSAATAMAMVYLAGGTYVQSCFAIQNVLSDCTGMLCDGAKSTCAMKVKTSTSSAFTSFILAMQNKEVRSQGIIADEIEHSIRNVGSLITTGMATTDTAIINIMSA